LPRCPMKPLIEEFNTTLTPELLCEQIGEGGGLVLLRTALFDDPQARYSFVAADPFLTFRSSGSRCEVDSQSERQVQFGNPWHLLDVLMARYEVLDEVDLPFPLGGCFGFWGYDLKNFVEPRLTRLAVNDLELPDCAVGFYDSLAVFDHRLGKTWIVSTGLSSDGSRSRVRARERVQWWREQLAQATNKEGRLETLLPLTPAPSPLRGEGERSPAANAISSNLRREQFISLVQRAQEYIRAGDIYQVNLAQRFRSASPLHPWSCFRRLTNFSPAPFAAFLDCGEFQIISSSPELFLRLSGSHIQTRPIKGTRPRSSDPTRDAQLTYELQTSAKEMSELVMITDLLRNDLGKICDYGSVQVPELVRLERYPQVQHLVSTVEGHLRRDVTHFAAFASCFPGGSVTGAPKIRAMEIIDELEPVTRGPYTGSIGYLGFNRESRLSIAIRTALSHRGEYYFHAGAGIVADSAPEAEYEETLAKAGGFFAAVSGSRREAITDESPVISSQPRTDH
jgi:para-aminobenzoate synthetase component I